MSDFNTKDFNIIIIGDSHGGDLFNSLSLNSDLFGDIKFYYVGDIFSEIPNGSLKNEKFLEQLKTQIYLPHL